MKRVSFKVAKAIEAAGYPQYYNNFDGTNCHYVNENTIQYHSPIGCYTDVICAAPFVLDVWLWLWKNISIQIEDEYCTAWAKNSEILYQKYYGKSVDNPEEAIDTAIEYLVDNNLIK